MKDFFVGWQWSAFIGFLNILGFVGVKMDFVASYIDKMSANDLAQYFFLFLAVCFFLYAIFMKSGSGTPESRVLKDIAGGNSHNEYSLWDYGSYGRSVVQTNHTWQEWISELVKTTNRADLDYYNFGEEFYLYDFGAGKEIKIPTGNVAKTAKVGDTIPSGKILRVMPKTP